MRLTKYKFLKYILLIGFFSFSVLGYLAWHSYRSLTFMDQSLNWFWLDNQLISLDNTAIQSARENHSKQLIYRQVYTHDQFVVFLNTTNNGYFLFTFVKKIPCNSSSPYQALLSINGKNSETVTFTCNSSDTAVYRVARKKFEQMQLTNRDLYFNLDLNKWDFNALKKDDYIQHNYRFFQKHSTKTVYPWNRD